MAWEWVTKKARKATELDAEYKSHSSLIDRLSELPPDTSFPEIERTWASLDDRARAGFKMTLGALILKQQAIRNARRQGSAREVGRAAERHRSRRGSHNRVGCDT